MSRQDYTVTIMVNVNAQEAFDGINRMAGWWTPDFEGTATGLHDIFTVRFGETFITAKITELVPGRKITWHVIDCYKHWLRDKKEWNGTTMHWEIITTGNATKINFVHMGLIPGIECYNGCEKAWNFYIGESLYKFLTGGKGMPG
jgi:hypothetical protein